MELKTWNRKGAPKCDWKGCDKAGFGAFPTKAPGVFIVLCSKHYKTARWDGLKEADLNEEIRRKIDGTEKP